MAGKFEPKTPVTLNPPKYDPISVEELEKCNGADSDKCYVAIKGKVYDVTGNTAYLPGGSYHVFAGHDASRALAKTSTSAADVSSNWFDLDDKEKGVLNDWNTFFSKRYNIVGLVDGAQNLEPEGKTEGNSS
ncbi:progesterone binding protein [Sclerotinia borealis F-4128]|uniref:Progesterone binding protein n=1 Tax=Sclerotinia borealis (strain F-4128) TaxID=1432307 RepID=W9C6P6_SCLBF|nr:progesterone binding protein [Sclerotinia borealis F-4128]